MADDEGFIIGPFGGDDENVPPQIRKIVEQIEQTRSRLANQQRDRQEMQVQATALGVRRMLESFDDDQLEAFVSLLGLLADEGRDNYLTASVYGMALAVGWQREPIGMLEKKEADGGPADELPPS